jgi:hypothetical protein
MFTRSRRGFLVGGVAALAGVFGWRWMGDETKAALLRRTFEFNERVSQIFYSPKSLAAEFPEARVTIPARYNGPRGLKRLSILRRGGLMSAVLLKAILS